ncbi:MAG TPA: phage/plasmid primase, P4 family [Terriglobales bacterium]|nr:phage/plasmid primase, P4 family [Terriglobales bacterium]
MTTTRNQPDLYPVEAWALARCINGMDVDPTLPLRHPVAEVITKLFKEEVKWRQHQLSALVDIQALEMVLASDPMQSPPKGRGKVPPTNSLKVGQVEVKAPDSQLEERQKPTDDELAAQLMERWDKSFAYIYSTWHKYDRGVWKPQKANALQFWEIQIENKKRGIKPNKGKAGSIEDYCQLRLLVEENNVDQTQSYINLENGLFNLETARMEPHRPDLYLTSQLPFSYDGRATCPVWLQFLKDVFVDEKGKPDQELITLVQEAFGYSLTAYTHLRASFWLVGPTGSGKSTLLKVLINLSGSGHLAIDLDAMKDNQYQMAEVAGKRLITFTEPDARSPLADGQYKRLVSSDTISARQIHGKPFNFIPQCKLWGAMNDTPRVMDRSDAVYGRIIILPMLNSIPKEKWDLGIDEKLRQELPGIFNWALQGWVRLQAAGQFSRARQSDQARDEYKSENDAEATYVEERIEWGERYSIKADELYQDYKGWCETNGFKPKNRNNVSKDWKRLKLTPHKAKDANYYIGIRLKGTDTKRSEDIPF